MSVYKPEAHLQTVQVINWFATPTFVWTCAYHSFKEFTIRKLTDYVHSTHNTILARNQVWLLHMNLVDEYF